MASVTSVANSRKELRNSAVLQSALNVSCLDALIRSGTVTALESLENSALEALLAAVLTIRERAIAMGAHDPANEIMTALVISELPGTGKAAARNADTGLVQATPDPITIGEISLDPTRRLVRKRNRGISLTPKEFDLLHCL
ncbi:MAG TPA: hypothetical protein VE641_20840, partial [Chthoniobacterales bacterium]|nr:hypothetical protein [Chthoniobacterales bacterium]